MKKSGVTYRILCFVLCMILMLSVSVSASNLDEDLSVTQGCHSVDAQVPMLGNEVMIENAVSVFLYDYANDVLLFTQNPDQQFYPASLVKIMTCLLIAEKGNLEDQVVIRQEVLDTVPEGSRSINLKAGEILALGDLYYAIMVQSSNEAAAIAADYISGSQEVFVNEMNSYAKTLGCTNTTFVNAHGLHHESQLSTSRDLAKILSAATKNEIFMQAFSSVHYTIPETNLSKERRLSSNNHLMNSDEMTVYLDSRVTGGRAGTMDSGERNLAVTAEYNDIHLISIVAGSKSTLSTSGRTTIFGSFKETTQLLDAGFKGYESVQLFYKDQILDQFEVVNGESKLSIGVKDSVSALLPHGVNYDALSYRYGDNVSVIRAPIKKDDIISTIQVWHGELCLAQANLYAMHDVNVRDIVATEEIENTPDGNSTSILVVVAIIVGLLVVLIIGRRLITGLIRRQQIRRHRRNRRRSY